MNQLRDLSLKRRDHVQSCLLNEDHSHSIIANLYSDSTHFLYELLQNAQDAGAINISFTLYPDRLESSHNGRAFSFLDVEAITTIGSSTKAGEPNKIGKFGAGFKSVFSITDTPHIYSGEFCFKISQYIIPESIETETAIDTSLTTLILPFDKEGIDRDTLYRSIAKRIRMIGKDEVLFLSNLSRIEWQIDTEEGFVEKQILSDEQNRSVLSIETTNKTERYELYLRDFEIEEKALQCKIAFALGENDRYVSSGSNHPLYVFFPTVVPTNLQFLIHAPYKTTPNRETINFSDPQNQTITDNIVDLYKAILIDMADRKVLEVETLQLLPLSPQSGELSQKLFNASVELFKAHPLIPTEEGGYALPSTVFSINSELDHELFHDAQIHTLFDKTAWIHEGFYKPINLVLKRFLNSYLSVMEYTLNDILHGITEEFLIAQSNEWMGRLYGQFDKAKHYVNGYLSSRPLARLEDGRQIPFKSEKGEVQVYIHPGVNTHFLCLHPDTTVSDSAASYMSSIGIKTPDIIDEIKEFIFPIITVFPNDADLLQNYLHAIKTLVQTFESAPLREQTRMIELIKNTACILSTHTAVQKLVRPNEAYLPTQELKRWFSEDIAITMMDETLWNLLNATELGTSLSFLTRPVIEPIPPHIDTAHKEKLRHTPSIADRGGDDFQWVGLEALLSTSVDKELSLIIWKFLISYLDEKKNILRGYYRWQGEESKSHEKEFDSKICVALKQTAWLFTSDDKLCKPTEIKLEELMDEYRYDTLGVEVKELLSLLSFKTDAIEEIEKMGLKVVTIEEYEVLNNIKRLQQQAIIDEEPIIWDPAALSIAAWVSEIDPDMDIQIEKPELKQQKHKDLRYQTPQSFFEEEGDERQYIQIIPKAVRKSIGEWSEKYVYRYLQDFCEENKDKGYHIRWMNEEKNVGWGYDFVLMKGDIELRYIEVKGRATNTSEIEISKTQWGFAKFLFDKGEGDKYSIFIVQNAGKSSAKLIPINNPVKMWLDGNLSMLKIELSL